MNNPFLTGMNSAIKRKRDDGNILLSDENDSDGELLIEEISVDEDSNSDADSRGLVDDDDDSDLYPGNGSDSDSDSGVKKRKKEKEPAYTWRYTVLPEDSRDRNRIADIEFEDEKKGFNSKDPCELCRLVDETAEVYPKSLQEYYEYERIQSSRLPPERLNKLLKVKFNDLCYKLDQETGGKANVKKMTMSGIRQHREHTMSFPHHVVDLVTVEIDYLRKSLHHIRFSESWEEHFIDGKNSGPIRMNNAGSLKYARQWKLLKEALELREKLRSNMERESGAGRGGKGSVGFKGKASSNYLSFKPC